MTDSKGFYWNSGVLLRSESVSIIRFPALTTNVGRPRDLFCAHVIKGAPVLPSAALRGDFGCSAREPTERAGTNLHLGIALIFLKTKHFSDEME